MSGTQSVAADAAGELAGRLGALEQSWQSLVGAWDVEAARAFSDALDSLLELSRDGLAERAADLAAYLSTFADGSLVPNRSQLGRLMVLSSALFSTAPDAPASPATPSAPVVQLPAPPPRPQEARSTICLLGVAENDAPGLTDSLTERGYQVRRFGDAAELEAYLKSARPGVLMLHSAQLRSMPRLAAALADAAPGTPLGPALIVLSGQRDVTQRLLAMRSGATAFFEAPLDSYRIVARIEELLGREQATPYRVLLVDADREHSSQCGRWPDARAFELAQMMHQQPEFATLPIVLYGEGFDDAQRFDAIAAGAEDVLVKPLKPRHLTSVIRSRVQRAQWFRGQAAQTAGRDPRTGMYLRSYIVDRLGAGALPSGCALLFVGLDRTERVREALGLAGLAQFESEIAQAFREALAAGDAAAPLNDFSFLVMATRDHRDLITELAERLRQKLAERRAGGGDAAQPVTASVGITLLDDVGGTVDERVARAEAAAMAAARVGGNRVLWYEPNNYALVRPDPQLAVRAVLTRPWNESNCRIDFRPIVPLAGKLGGQYDLAFSLVSANEPGARAEYLQYAPVAREMQALAELDKRRFVAAMTAREERLRHGRQIRLFMPVLADTLLDEPLMDWLVAELRSRKLSGTGFTFELTSAELLDRREALAAPLARLRQAGIRTGLADFGRDWAAVHVLGELQADFLRLDTELVLMTTTDKAVNSTLLALVRKAHSLGAQVIAPDVEAIERAHVLLRLGIDYGVGDGLARPVAEPEFDFNRPIW
jgi:EAL domain-containing protein (putative c-di-GMP-specific phosphodiesterase class I)/GGDEF domain-containing protein